MKVDLRLDEDESVHDKAMLDVRFLVEEQEAEVAVMATTATIHGPLGPFFVPSRPDAMSEKLARAVFVGEYSHPKLPHDGIRTILDIGANVGAFSVWARWMWPGATIEAYEPNTEAAMFCEANMTSGILHRLAVTTNPEPVLHIAPDLGWASTTFDDMGRVEHVKVPAIHPRDLPPCDLLKVDVEGGEVEIFENYPHLGGCKVVFFEFHGGPPLGKKEDRERLSGLCEAAGMKRLRLDDLWQGIGIFARDT